MSRVHNLLLAALLGAATAPFACTTATIAAGLPHVTRAASAATSSASVSDIALTTHLQPVGLDPVGEHAAFPSLVQHPDHSLTLAWRQGSDHVDHRDGRIVTATSPDVGLTYRDQATTLAGGHDYRDPSLSLIGGHQYLTYFTGSAGLAAEGAYVTRDGGAPVRIDTLPYAAISAPVVQLPDGRLGAAFYGRRVGEAYDTAWMGWSVDGGQSWSINRILNSGISTAEPWLVVDGGMVHMVARWGSSAIAMRSSADSGRTWGAVRVIVTDCGGRPTTIVTQAGTLVMVCRGPLSLEGPSAKVVYSLDHGQNWRVGPTILTAPAGSPNGMTYAAMAEVLPGVIHVVVGMEQADGSSQLYRGWLAEVTR